MPTVEQLTKRLAQHLKAKKLDAALEDLVQLSKVEPDDPNWPRRIARMLHAKSDFEGELAAHRRALELQVDRGLVLDAIASCKSILELAPDDARTLDTLDLLYLNGSSSHSAPSASAARDADADTDGPLDTLSLSDVVPGARSVQIADAKPGRINEIPIDAAESFPNEEVVDLKLEDWTPSEVSKDLAAAQAVSLPASQSDGRRRKPVRIDRGVWLRNELANVPLFGELDPASLHTLIREVRVVTLDAGDVLFRQGDPARSLYVIVEGAVVPIAEGDRRRKLAVLERGQFFGEIGLIAKQPRNATIEALVDTKLLAIDRRVLRSLVATQASVARSILRFLRARLIDRQIRTNLFFSAFAHAERDTIARQFRLLEVKDGTRIVEQGKPPEGLFVVLSGSLSRIDRKRRKDLGDLGLGDVFGGLSLIEGQPSPSDIVARGKCWLVVLGEGRFRRILDANPRLARVIRRLADDGHEAGEGPSAPAL
jgi:CRP-like cAMP-binding protein